MTKKPAKKTAGRPRGTKTAQRAVVEKQCTPCPGCGCTREPVKKRLIREGPASGTHQGRAYGYYRMHHANCAQCNRAVVLKEYDYLQPEEAPSPTS